MSDLLSDSWEQEYLKKADRYEKICLKNDKAGYEEDLQGSAATAETACRFLRKTAIVSKGFSVFFLLIILLNHSTSEHSSAVMKNEQGYFAKMNPLKVND